MANIGNLEPIPLDELSPQGQKKGCWCGRRDGFFNLHGSSCLTVCGKALSCENPGIKCHKVCLDICHPGPCALIPCESPCPSKQNTVTTVVEAVPEGELPPRTPQQGPSSKSKACWFLIPFTILTVIGIIWATTRVGPRIHPLSNIHWSEKWRTPERIFANIYAVVGALLIAVTGFCGFGYWRKALIEKYNIPGGSRRKLMTFLMILIVLAASIGILVAFWVAPHFAWAKEMHDSCDGFETRILDQNNLPSETILLSSLERRSDLDSFVFNKTNDSSRRSAELFSSYWRMSAPVADKRLYVDFDLRFNRWRTLNVTYPPSQPETGRPKPTSTTLDRIGTWSEVNKTSPHLHLNGLQLHIPNFYYFDKHCFYQPFMTVFNTNGMNASDIQRQSEEEWSPESKENVVMRTVSFGKYPSQLEACIPEWNYEVVKAGKEYIMRDGMTEEMVVPLGLIAATRLQMKEDGRYSKGCDLLGRLA